MKSLWEQMSTEMEKQKKTNNLLVLKITQQDYRHKINRILIPEAIGGLGCIAEAVFIILSFSKVAKSLPGGMWNNLGYYPAVVPNFIIDWGFRNQVSKRCQ